MAGVKLIVRPINKLLAVLQLVTTALCITAGDVTAAENKREEDDLDTQETGWLYNPIQEKVRALEYLKSKVLSPLVTLQSPSTFYGGGGYPVYSVSGGGGLSSGYSYGSRYPSYYSNGYKNNYYSGYYRPGSIAYPTYVPQKSKFNLYPSLHPPRPVYSPKVWYNTGYYGGSSSYAPGCTYPSLRPSYTYGPSPTYTTSGTPLSYQYATSSSYGVPSASFSAKGGFSTGFGLKTYATPQYSDAGQSSGSYITSPSLPEGIPGSGAFPPLHPSLPSPPQIPQNPYIPAPGFPSTTPSTPANPSNDLLVKAVIFPHRAADDAQSSGAGSYPFIPSIPSGPSYPSIPSGPSYPSIPSGPSYPSIPSAPTLPSAPQVPYSPAPMVPSYSSVSSALPSTPSLPAAVTNFPSTVTNELPSKPPYTSFESVPFKPTLRLDYNGLLPNIQSFENGNQEVIITPPPPKAKINFITALPGSSIGISPDYYPYQPDPAYAVSYYPNVFYISNQQNNGRPSAAGVSEAAVDSQPSDESTATSTDTTPSSESSTASSSQRSSRPVITSYYSSNTIDQTRVPLLFTAEQYSVPAAGVYYSNLPSDPSYSYGTPLGQQGRQTSSNINAYASLGQAAQPLSVTTASPPC